MTLSKQNAAIVVVALALVVVVVIGGRQQAAEEEAKTEERAQGEQARAEERRKEEVAAEARKAESDRQIEGFTAYRMAQQFVQRELKSPATAEFPSVVWNASDVKISYSDVSNTFTIGSHVDSQNAFGGIVRTSFLAEMQHTNDNWTLVNLQFAER